MDDLRLSSVTKLEDDRVVAGAAAPVGDTVPIPKRKHQVAMVNDNASAQLREELQRLKWQNEVLTPVSF